MSWQGYPPPVQHPISSRNSLKEEEISNTAMSMPFGAFTALLYIRYISANTGLECVVLRYLFYD